MVSIVTWAQIWSSRRVRNATVPCFGARARFRGHVFLGLLLLTFDGAMRGAPLNEEAEKLVQTVPLERTDYRHGREEVEWADPAHCYTDCSGFLDALLMHTYQLRREDLRAWLGAARPNAAAYFQAVAEKRHFQAVSTMVAIRPGDVLVVKYLHRTDNSGHVMIADGEATPLPSLEGSNRREWQLPIIDCSESGHGPQDTRHHRGESGKDHPGLGRGVLRIFSDADGHPTGFSWSTLKSSALKGSDTEPLLIGRPEIKSGLRNLGIDPRPKHAPHESQERDAHGIHRDFPMYSEYCYTRTTLFRDICGHRDRAARGRVGPDLCAYQDGQSGRDFGLVRADGVCSGILERRTL